MPTDPVQVPIKRIEDLLTDDERAELTRELTRMARERRRAADFAANWSLP